MIFLKETSRLRNFPVSFFAVALGLMGFTLAFQKAGHVFSFIRGYEWSLVFSNVVFIVISLIYITKLILCYAEVEKEFNHPVKINFFPLIAKIFLVASIIFLEINSGISEILWFAGVAIQFLSSLGVMSIWFNHTKFQYMHLNPSWFIPIVGNVLIPVAGVVHGYSELSWFFFSVGVVMWLTLFIIVFNRIIFHEPIAQRLIPTLFILFAPPAVAFVAYVKLTGGIDAFARILYYIALFLFIFVWSQFRLFRQLKFFLSWWAYSFPMAAITVATIVMYHVTKIIFFKGLAFGLFAVLISVMILLMVRTVRAIKNRSICIDEDH